MVKRRTVGKREREFWRSAVAAVSPKVRRQIERELVWPPTVVLCGVACCWTRAKYVVIEGETAKRGLPASWFVCERHLGSPRVKGGACAMMPKRVKVIPKRLPGLPKRFKVRPLV